MSTNEKKPEQVICSPPSHPTTLGPIWVGKTRPSPASLEMLKIGSTTSEKSWNK